MKYLKELRELRAQEKATNRLRVPSLSQPKKSPRDISLLSPPPLPNDASKQETHGDGN